MDVQTFLSCDLGVPMPEDQYALPPSELYGYQPLEDARAIFDSARWTYHQMITLKHINCFRSAIISATSNSSSDGIAHLKSRAS